MWYLFSGLEEASQNSIRSIWISWWWWCLGRWCQMWSWWRSLVMAEYYFGICNGLPYLNNSRISGLKPNSYLFKCLVKLRHRQPSTTFLKFPANDFMMCSCCNERSFKLEFCVQINDHIYRMVKESNSNIWPNQTIVTDQSELTILLCQPMIIYVGY